MTGQGRLEGKVALITGGGAGIGAATAKLFCAEGAAVVLVDVSDHAVEATMRTVSLEVPDARISEFVADVADPVLAADAVSVALDAFGGLDILVNNAAMRNYASLADATPEEWHAVLSVNMVGTASYCKAALPALRRSGRASIVNVSSCYAVAGRKGMGLYDATKAAMLALTRTLACEEAVHKIRANAICPGSTLTDFHLGRAAKAGTDLEQLKTQRQDSSLIGRWAQPEEVAWPILWLASDEASFVTGATLMVDGGLSII